MLLLGLRNGSGDVQGLLRRRSELQRRGRRAATGAWSAARQQHHFPGWESRKGLAQDSQWLQGPIERRPGDPAVVSAPRASAVSRGFIRQVVGIGGLGGRLGRK